MEMVSTHRMFGRVRNAILFGGPLRLLDFEVHLFAKGKSMRRGLVAAHLRGPGRVRITAVSAHLGLMDGERVRHARELTDYIASVEGPVVLGADLNEGPERPAARWISERLFDAFEAAGEGPGETFPSASPSSRIDYLFVSEHFRVLNARVASGAAAEEASDHRPLVAELEVG